MTSFRMEIKGVQGAINYLDEVGRSRIPLALKNGLTKGSILVKSVMRKNAPVDTGNLRSSIRRKVNASQGIATIGPDPSIAHYAYWVEFGHHTRSGGWVPGQYYVQYTYFDTIQPVQEIFNVEIKKAIKT